MVVNMTQLLNQQAIGRGPGSGGVQVYAPGRRPPVAPSRRTTPRRRNEPEMSQWARHNAERQWVQQQEEEGGGDSVLGRGLGFLISNPVSQAVLKPLEYLDYGRRAVTLGIEELSEIGGEGASAYDENGVLTDTRSNWDKLKDPTYGVGQLIRDVSFDDSFGNVFDKGVGFVGDVALDPLTWVTAGAGTAIGKAGKAGAITKLGKAQDAADAAIDAARRAPYQGTPGTQKVIDDLIAYRGTLGSKADLEKYARRGIATATQPQMDAMELGQRGLNFGTRKNNFHIPGSTPIAKGWHEGLGTARSIAKKTPGAKKVMGTRNYRGVLTQDLTPALNTLAGMPGANKKLSMADAINHIDFDQHLRATGAPWAAPLKLRLDDLAKEWEEAGPEAWKKWRHEAATQGPKADNPLTRYAAEIRKWSKDRFGVDIPEIEGGVYSMPHILARDFRDHLAAAVEAGDVNDIKPFMGVIGITTEDLMQDSGFAAKRHFTAGENIKIGDDGFTINTGTIDELNEKFSKLFPDFDGPIYEVRPDVAYRHYLESMQKQVAKRASFQQIADEATGLVKKAGRTPDNFDPAGGPSPFPAADGEDLQDLSTLRTRQENPLPNGNPYFEPHRSQSLTKARNKEVLRNRDLVDELEVGLENAQGQLRDKVREDIRAVIAPVREYHNETNATIRRLINENGELVGQQAELAAARTAIDEEITAIQKAIKSVQGKRRRIVKDTVAKGNKAAQAERAAYDETIAALEDRLAGLEARAVEAATDHEQRLQDLLERAGVPEAQARYDATPEPPSRSGHRIGKAGGKTGEPREWSEPEFFQPERTPDPVRDERLAVQKEIEADTKTVRDWKALERRQQMNAGATAEPMKKLSAGSYEYSVGAETYKIKGKSGAWEIEPPERLNIDAPAGKPQPRTFVERPYRTLKEAQQGAEAHRVMAKKQLGESAAPASQVRANAANMRERINAEVRKNKAAAAEAQARLSKNEARLAELSSEAEVPMPPPAGSAKAKIAARENLDEAVRRAETIPTEPTDLQVMQSKAVYDQAVTDYNKAVNKAEADVKMTGVGRETADEVPQVAGGRDLAGRKKRRARQTGDVRPKTREVPTERAARRAAERIVANRPLYKKYLQYQNEAAELGSRLRAHSDGLRAGAGDPRVMPKAMAQAAEDRLADLNKMMKGTGGATGFRKLMDDIDTVDRWDQFRVRVHEDASVTQAKSRMQAAFVETPQRNAQGKPGGMLTGEGTEMDAIRRMRDEETKILEEIRPQIEAVQSELTATQRMKGLAPVNAERRSVADSNRRVRDLTKEEALNKEELAAKRLEGVETDEALLGSAQTYDDNLKKIKEGQGEAAIADAVLDKNRRAADMGQASSDGKAVAMEGAVEDAQRVLDYSKTLPNGPDKDAAEAAAAMLITDLKDAQTLENIQDMVAAQRQMINDAESGKLGSVIEYILRKDKYRATDDYNRLVTSPEFAESLKQVRKFQDEPGHLGRLLKAYTNFFKTYATMTPGFHLRNGLSAIFMNAVEGVSFRTQWEGMAEWSKYARSDNPVEYMLNLKKTDPDMAKAFDAVFASGAGGRFFEAGIASGGEAGTRIKEGVYSNWATTKSQKFGSWVEGPARLGLAIDTVRNQKGSVEDALNRVTKIHFDYGQISDFDEKAKRLIPFWTFMSRNLPTQITMMYAKPKTYAKYNSFIRNFTQDNDPLTPSYWEDQGAFNTGFSLFGSPVYIQPDLQHTRLNEDIEMLEQALSGDPGRLISSGNPGLTAPIEALTGHDFFRGYNTPADQQRKVGLWEMPAAVLGTILGKEHGTDWGAEGGPLVNERLALMLQSLIPDLDRGQRVVPQLGGDEYRSGAGPEGALRYLGLPVRQLTDQRRESEAKRQEVPFIPSELLQ